MIGNIHSVESCGTVDGPGIRYVVFTQGCLLRCQFCHNPDTWGIGEGKDITVDEIVNDLKAYLPFIKASNGGITVSGGEPLLQIPFVTALFKACKKLGISTALDSSGGCFSERPEFLKELDGLLKYTDLVLLDLKHIDTDKHKRLTGKHNEHILTFAHYLSDKKIPVWVRHVLVPSITDSNEDLAKLGEFISTLSNVKKIEILPYHKLGVYKWETLGLQYPLEGIEPPSEASVNHAYSLLNRKSTDSTL